jgi:hypothetical protein
MDMSRKLKKRIMVLLTAVLALVAMSLGSIAGVVFAASPQASGASPGVTAYRCVDTTQANCYDNNSRIAPPGSGKAFFGQDAQYQGDQPSYTKSPDGLTVTDHDTGLVWQSSPDTNGDSNLNASDKLDYEGALARPATLNSTGYGGYGDWRLPTIKELYSLIEFKGTDPNPMAGGTDGLIPFIDTAYFKFAYGDAAAGERVIDSQFASSTVYAANSNQLFGVNFADGRIKGYGLTMPDGRKKTFFVLCVRGNTSYGENSLLDNTDGTVTDSSTGLIWAKADSGTGMNWQQALEWVQHRNAAKYLGHSDWRLPNAKELQTIVDYSRSPDTTASAAIGTAFTCTQISNEAGNADYPYYWTGTTHASSDGSGKAAVYIAFGRAMGYMNGSWVDVHGAGAQRSDPKSGNPADYPQGRGPQGDAIRINNYVRVVRGGVAAPAPVPGPGPRPKPDPNPGPNPNPNPQHDPDEPDYNGPHYARTCGTSSIGVTEPAKAWYLAEGATDGGFETWVLVQNPGEEAAEAKLTYMTDKGEVAGPTMQIPAESRVSVRVGETVKTFSVSTKVTSDQGVVAERSTYFRPPHRELNLDGTSSIGVTAPASTWYMAEGSSAGGFETWILVQNPGEEIANASITYMTDKGEVEGPVLQLEPGSRKSVLVNDTVKAFSVSSKVTSDQPVVAERATYFTTPGRDHRVVAHSHIGVTAPDTTWYMAEGSTAGGFQTWVLVQNPGDQAANVTLSYMTDKGEVAGPVLLLAPNSRQSVRVDDTVKAFSVSTKVTSDQPVIAERSVYFRPPEADHWMCGTSSPGVNSTSTTWYMAEGATAGGFETWVLVQNPGDEAASATLTYMTDKGAVEGPTIEVAAHSRKTVSVDATIHAFNVSSMVVSDKPVIAERAVYRRTRGRDNEPPGGPQ